MKLLISAGETSGDQRAAEVLAALNRTDAVEAFGLGGNMLAAGGMTITHHLSSYAVMGFGEILFSLGKFLKLEKDLKALCLKERPDCILLVDYPGFNMRFGRWAKKHGFPVVHYIAPQMWAWGAWRVRKLRKSTHILLTLFAFEVPFFEERGVRAVFTGHPLKNSIQPQLSGGDALGLLPGSRHQEVEKLLPPMLEAFRALHTRGVVNRALLAVSPHLERNIYAEAENTQGVELADGTEKVLAGSKAALVCSGTATLETALYGVPFVVCYRTGVFTYALAKHLVKGVDTIGLANIIAGTEVAPELIQNDVTPDTIISLLEPLLSNRTAAEAAREKLLLVGNALGDGDPAENAAAAIVKFVREFNER
jgi:lipid-A-disaccharide synthase